MHNKPNQPHTEDQAVFDSTTEAAAVRLAGTPQGDRR